MRQSGTITFPIIVVFAAICYIYYSTVFVFIDGWFGLMTSPGLLNAVTFTLTAIVCLVTYWIAIVRDPGGVPSTFMPDIEDSETPIHEIKRKGGDLRYCQKCSRYKPPRAHHCRVCKRCVLRMDHHCIWINNCVGHANYKIFFVFVLYAVTACVHSLILLVGSVINDAEKDDQNDDGSPRIYYIISGVLLVPLAMALGILLGWHVYLILQNKTTIEYHEGVRAMWLAEKVGNVYTHPYDLGPYQNLTTLYLIPPRCWGQAFSHGSARPQDILVQAYGFGQPTTAQSPHHPPQDEFLCGLVTGYGEVVCKLLILTWMR
ncbi:zinc finger protein [Macleaya cordata]|uniref:S-acyltransferase n=1 Tax=Macleaya cordata TaxID=56857 RepID=A0A200PM40_MACCD|nr:zinc finger protein [Macleaya cordata]